jgi:hypothetical protein
MFTDECLKYVDVCTLCEVLDITVDEIIAAFPDKLDECLEELKELFDNE